MAIEINQSALPYSLDAEQTVIGTILIDSTAMSEVGAFLRAEHFHAGLHSQLFGVMHNMFIANSPIDLVTVIEQSVREKVFENQDEARGYLLKLAESVVNPSGVGDYAKIITEKHMIRSLMYACKDIFDMAAEGAEKPGQIMDAAEKKIYDLRGERELGGLVPIQSVIKDKIDELKEIQANPDARKEKTIPSSFSGLDYHIFGLNPSDLILIAGRPGMGKTSFALNIAVGAAKLRPEKEVVIFSLEMGKDQLMTRLLSSEASITNVQMRSGQIDSEGWRSIYEAAEVMSKLKMFFDDGAGVSIGEMKAKLRRMKNLGLVVIDYLQLMSTGRKDGNRVLEVSEITRSLKLMAKDLNVPVIVASQLSRAAAQRGKTEKRPVLTDLRDSGSIEQDADIVLFLYREDYDNYEAVEDPDFNPNLCECIVAKNRQGDTGTVKLNWDKDYTRFTTMDTHHDSQQPYG
ncbi:MAG: replicative DNA helicase [Oscillospiraceae bacterium]|nr:replicative DNA helicase [Oscillospiraceae bacterium]